MEVLSCAWASEERALGAAWKTSSSTQVSIPPPLSTYFGRRWITAFPLLLTRKNLDDSHTLAKCIICYYNMLDILAKLIPENPFRNCYFQRPARLPWFGGEPGWEGGLFLAAVSGHHWSGPHLCRRLCLCTTSHAVSPVLQWPHAWIWNCSSQAQSEQLKKNPL